MRFECESCGKRFASVDEPVPGRTYRIKCRCGHVIHVRTRGGAPARPVPPAPPAGSAGAVHHEPTEPIPGFRPAPAPAPPGEDPFARAAANEQARRREAETRQVVEALSRPLPARRRDPGLAPERPPLREPPRRRTPEPLAAGPPAPALEPPAPHRGPVPEPPGAEARGAELPPDPPAEMSVDLSMSDEHPLRGPRRGVIVVIAMAAAVGGAGAYLFAVSGTRDATPTASATATTPTTTATTPTTTATTPTTTTPTTTPPDLGAAEALSARRPAFQACVGHARSPKAGAGLRSLVLVVTVSPSGRAEGRLEFPEHGSAPLETCLREVVREILFPPFDGSPLTIRVPLSPAK